MKALIQLLRPHQYVKNLFVFLPLFFAGKALEWSLLLQAFLAFIAFCACASAVYILNDYRDIAADRLHPRKKYRPLASGRISKRRALTIGGVLTFISFPIALETSANCALTLLAYFILNLAYSFKLKNIPILDISIIATGFVLRLFVGATATGVALSMWIVIMTFLLALFLALAKRRDDVLIFNDTGKKMRHVVEGYNLEFIDGAMMIMSSVVIVAYILYTTSQPVLTRLHSHYLYITAIFVLLGILRYLQIALVEERSGSPTQVLLHDRFIQLDILCWVFSYVWIIYL